MTQLSDLNSMPEDFKHRYQQVGTEISELAPQGKPANFEKSYN